MTISEADWREALTALGVRPATLETWAPAFADEVQPERFSQGMDDVLAWLPQILHETTGRNLRTASYGPLERLEENLSYNAERMCAVWPSRFPTPASAIPYVHMPERLANFVYANRLGNGGVESGHGWLYRGRCPIMATGLEAYRLLERLCGQDFTVLPDLLLQPRFGLEAAIAWWEGRVPDTMLADTVKLRRRVNGGEVGLEHVQALALRVREVFA